MINRKLLFRRAFTLLEILVVMGIIAILLGLGSVAYSTAQKKARDARRNGDLQAAQKVMEQCYAVNSYQYPAIGAGAAAGSITATCPAPNTSITFTITDPLNSGSYVYAYTNSSPVGTTYSITATAEIGTLAPVTNQQ